MVHARTIKGALALFALVALPTGAALGTADGPPVPTTPSGAALAEVNCNGRMLQVQPEDSGTATWGCVFKVTNANSPTDGFLNGQAIIAGCGDDGGATSVCARLATDDTPWYVPASGELLCLWDARDRIGGFHRDLYWSSTESTAAGKASGSARDIYFSTRFVGDAGKGGLGKIRCVRAMPCGTPPQAPSAMNDGPHCAGSRLQLAASEVPGASYLWTGPNGQKHFGRTVRIDEVTAAAAGSWNVRAVVNGCWSAKAPTEVVIQAAPKPTIRSEQPPILCPGRQVTLIADGAEDYVWSTRDKGPSLVVSQPGTYTAHATHRNGCRASSAPTKVESRGAAAGADQRDLDAPSATLAANREAGAGSWSIVGAADGRGRIASSTDPTSAFTGSEGETYTLRWTVANECGTTSSDTHLSFKGYPRLRCGDRTLVVMPSDAATDKDWGCWRADAERGKTGINTGARSEWNGNENTATIKAHECGPGSAAAVCAALKVANREDWYLPAANELRCLMENRASLGMTSGTYWSSTEGDNPRSESAWQAHVPSGAVYTTWKWDKDGAIKVRCVRRGSP